MDPNFFNGHKAIFDSDVSLEIKIIDHSTAMLLPGSHHSSVNGNLIKSLKFSNRWRSGGKRRLQNQGSCPRSWKQPTQRQARDLKRPWHLLPLSYHFQWRLIQNFARKTKSPSWVRWLPTTYAQAFKQHYEGRLFVNTYTFFISIVSLVASL